jgi:2-keto-4-pentenoate hydratase/2-oxohepta-3-ene-1,7-dioic acid hydratase in catechol pathway
LTKVATASGYRLLTYRSDRGVRAGVLLGDVIYDVADGTGVAADISVLELLGDWPATDARLKGIFGDHASSRFAAIPLAQASLRAPMPVPGTIYCAGANYSDHAAEMARSSGVAPAARTKADRSWHFLKSSRTVVGSGAPVDLPKASQKVDWEVELAAIIGHRGKDVSLEDALDLVAGYTIANDLSARDLSRRLDVADSSPFKMDWLSHKNFDGSCPLGPWITPAEFVEDPQALELELSVNGIVKQKSSTAAMIFSLAEQIRDLSTRITLWPGDVILTGTPAGVGSSRGEFLKSGDIVRARIEGLGELINEMR